MTRPIVAEVEVPLKPADALSFSWTQTGWPDDARTVVTVTLTESDTGTHVVLTHDGFDSLPLDRQADQAGYAGGWSTLLAWFAERAEPTTR